MLIQNPNLANLTVGLRYERDEDGTPIAVVGDDRGVFDMPERDALFLLETNGWSRARKAREADALAPTAAPKPVAAALSDTEPPPEPPDEEQGEFDLGTASRDELLVFAENQGIEDVNRRWGEDRLREHIRAALEGE